MKATVIVTVPTAYQYRSAAAFMSVQKTMGGSYTGSLNFDTKKEARKWLIEKAEQLLSDGYYENKREMHKNIGRLRNGAINSLSYDAATCYIN